MRITGEICTKEEAQDFIFYCSAQEEALLLEAILLSLSFSAAVTAADKAGYVLEMQ